MSKKKKRRLFSPSIIVPISSAMVISIYIGYIIFFFNSKEAGLFPHFKEISFKIYLLCEMGMVLIISFNKKLLDDFLKRHPVIDGEIAIRRLKPIVRMNMYSVLFLLLFLGLGALTAVMSIFNHGLGISLIVVALSMLLSKVMKWYNHSEERVKQIECTNSTLENKLRAILECWIHKALPNF